MATVHRYRNWRICVYADDHLPPHFHIETPNGAVVIEIATMRRIAGSLPPQAWRDALRWAKAHASRIVEAWRQANERT